MTENKRQPKILIDSLLAGPALTFWGLRNCTITLQPDIRSPASFMPRENTVNRKFRTMILAVAFLCVAASRPVLAQQTGTKFMQDTIVVEAEGSFEADPDLAALTFDATSQDKNMKKAYDIAAQSMQRIVDLAQKSGIKKEDVSTGVLRVTPAYDRDPNKAKSYAVRGFLTIKVRDFSQVGPLVDSAVQEGIVDFRSLSYSLQDEEAAKQKAVGAAMKNALGRATAALAQTGQKVGAIRYASVDVRQINVPQVSDFISTDSVQPLESFGLHAKRAVSGAPPPPPPLPSVSPEKITVSATVQCGFQIQ